MNKNWTFNATDSKIAEQLSGFLPDKIFDIHAHIYRREDLNLKSDSGIWAEGPDEVSPDVWRENLSKITGGQRLSGGLFFPAPSPGCDIAKGNAYLLSTLEKEKSGRGLVLVSPEMYPDDLASLLEKPGISGMKPYHFFSNEKPTPYSSVKGFFPEWQMQLADQHGSVVMLHIVKSRAVDDPENIREVKEMCTSYPGIRLILAHAARSFHAPNIKGIKALRGLENVWFDTSGICEHEALITILREFGPKKLLWGSDFPVSQIRGRCVTAGDGFVWVDDSFCDWEKSALANPVLVGIESLRAIKYAADEFGLNRADLDNIFYHNAQRILFRNETPGNLTQDLYMHAKSRIPGGVQLLSKRPENMAPDVWPAYFSEARGCEVWDLDGKHYYDMVSNGIGACLLGYNDPDVNSAVRRRVNLGNMSSLNPPEEVELADLLCEVHPWAEQARFARCGGEICAVAVRIARATTDRSVIAVCGYHGWSDWYLAANLGESDALRGHLLPGLDPLGVPVELRGTTVTFTYNNRENFMEIIKKYGARLAAVIMEPCRSSDPDPGFLEMVRDETHRCGALLIFDEITIGWRTCLGGAHMRLGIFPDMAVFAKALGNGYPMSAVIGTKQGMEGANSSFISSTYWTESTGPTAAVTTINKMKKVDVPAHVAGIGKMIMSSWENFGRKHNLPVHTDGYPSLAHFNFKHDDSEKLRTIYTQMMLSRGFLAGTLIYPTMAHTNEIVGFYEGAIDEVFGEIAAAMRNGSVDKLLKGRVALSGFARLTK